IESAPDEPQKTPDIEAKASKPKETPKYKETPNKEEPNSSPKNNVKEIDGFVLLTSLDSDIIIDLKYATTDNFTKKIIYPSKISVLRKNTAEKLVNANTELKKLGYRIKVWDGYRPVYVQQIFWDIVKDSRFVANPKNGGSIHNKGCAVDVTLVDKNGNDVNMPSKFDDFSSKASRTNSKMTNETKKNMNLLTKCMIDNGFTTINTEWWHFEDADSKNYKIANINLNLFLEKN
ncbi:MAG: M15 family metallopeptidase, partial [Clostridium sp.]